MATKLRLNISDLADILTVLREVTESYQLGIQLNIAPSTLKAIEKNHHGDIDRQRTEVVEYWLRNSSDASWITLANAVERVGGYGNIVQTLRDYADHKQTSEEIAESDDDYLPTTVNPQSDFIRTTCTLPIFECVSCNVVILGKREHGKSTLGNRMLNSDGYFKINGQESIRLQTCCGSAMLDSVSQSKRLKLNIYDQSGLFEGFSSVDTFFSSLPRDLNLVVIVLKHGRSFEENEQEILKVVMNKWKISRISALVVTHCERLSEEEREKMIDQFKEDHPSVAELMGKGILAVGFPDNSHVQPGSQLSQSVEDDKAKLRQLIYSCDEPVFIPHRRSFRCSIL